MERPVIYLDNAATSWPKPPRVAEEMSRFLRQDAANPGRGGYRMSVAAASMIERLRERLAALINAESPEQLILTSGCTDSLNLAIHGVIEAWHRAAPRESSPPRVVTTAIEHNSVSRPLAEEAHLGRIEMVQAGCDARGRVHVDEIISACNDQTVLVALTHASNVFGTIQPVAQIARRVRAAAPGALILIDAGQTAGCIPIDVQSMGIDLLAFPGHKALLGPTGIGGLYVGPRAHDIARDVCRIVPMRQGGTGGGDTVSGLQPRELPVAFEAGTCNAVGAAGLLAALESLDLGRLEQERQLVGMILEHYRSGGPSGRVHTTGPALTDRVPLVSLRLDGIEPSEVEAVLDEAFGIAVRSGLHCSPGAHRAAGTHPGGMVRISPGAFSKHSEIQRLIEGLDKLMTA